MSLTLFGPARGLLCALALGAALPAFAQDTSDPTEAQPTLAKAPLVITTHDGVAHNFSVEIARTPRQQQVGEMYRQSVPTDGGMLFVWPEAQQSDIWMRHTLSSLDVLFIDDQGHVQAITENAVPESEAIISSRGPVIATLELAAGVTEKLGIAVGDRVTSQALPH